MSAAARPRRARPSPEPRIQVHHSRRDEFTPSRGDAPSAIHFSSCSHVVSALPAVVWVLGQARRNEPFQAPAGRVAAPIASAAARPQDRRDQAGLALALECPPARRPSRRGSRRTRRCPCARRPPFPRSAPAPCTGTVPRSVPLLRQRLVRVARAEQHRRRRSLGRASQLGQAEVEELGARLRQHDVARLQVAVDDAVAVRLVEGVRDLDAVAQHLIGRQRAASPGDRPASRPSRYSITR